MGHGVYRVYQKCGNPKIIFVKMKISKNGKICILIYQKSYPLTWILIIPHPQIWRDKRGLKIFNWTEGRLRLIGGSFERFFDNKHTPKISSRYNNPIQNDSRSNVKISFI